MATASCSDLLRAAPHHFGNGLRQPLPLGFFSRQLFASGGCEAVVACLPVLVGHLLPVRRNPALFQKSVQCRVERTVVHLQDFVRQLLDESYDAVAMGRPQEQGPEDQHVEGTLHEGDAVAVGFLHATVEFLLSSRRAWGATVSHFPETADRAQQAFRGMPRAECCRTPRKPLPDRLIVYSGGQTGSKGNWLRKKAAYFFAAISWITSQLKRANR